MAEFDFSTLVTNRSAADLETLRDMLASPVSDWTAEELARFNRAESRGAYNFSDLNRVSECMDYLFDVFTSLGYAMPLYVKQSSVWTEGNTPTLSQMEQYLTNLSCLRSALQVFSTTPETPDSMVAFNFVTANNVEKILLDVNQLITSLSKVFLRAGMVWAVSGGPGFYFKN